VLFCSLGQYLGSGLIDMWRISPIFQVCISILKGLGHEIKLKYFDKHVYVIRGLNKRLVVFEL
jgi:hypothetical protein